MNKEEAYEWFVKGFLTASEGHNGDVPYKKDDSKLRQNQWFNEEFGRQWDKVNNDE